MQLFSNRHGLLVLILRFLCFFHPLVEVSEIEQADFCIIISKLFCDSLDMYVLCSQVKHYQSTFRMCVMLCVICPSREL